ncbi:hypothetical protein [Fodinicola acaciae]|uniref:hypothetical protein n=1 Tax=Fodinicola acaciae TaxID=2681555 RepID=UPI0013D079FE|nr:hypothetical protein [Fodinicola acaciae]
MGSPVSYFVDRQELLDQVERIMDDAVAAGECAYVHLYGPSGIGKTEFTRELEKRLRPRFAGPAVRVELATVTGPDRHAEYLRAALLCLGADPADLTDNVPILVSRLHTAMHGSRRLLVLDGVAGAAIAEMLRFDAPGSLIVLVSQERWEHPPAWFHQIAVPELKPVDSAELLTRRLAWHGRSCPDGVRTALLSRAAGFPLLVGIGAETLASMGNRDAERLFDTVFEGAVRASFEKIYGDAYDRLAAEEQRAYRLLSVHPVRLMPTEAAAVLFDRDLATSFGLLRRLEDKSLLTRSGNDWLFLSSAWQDADARRKAEDDEAPVVRRMIEWYLRTTASYELVLSARWRVAAIFAAIQAAAVTRQEAMDRLEESRPALSLLVRKAVEHDWPELAAALCEAMWSLLSLRNHTDDWLATHEMALSAVGETALAAHLHLQLVALFVRSHELDRAERSLERAERITRQTGHVFCAQSCLEWRARLQRERGDFADAARLYRDCLAFTEQHITDPAARARAVAMVHFHLGRLYKAWPGHAVEALAEFAAADGFFSNSTDRDNHANIRLEVAESHAETGREFEAYQAAQEALSIFVEQKAVDLVKRTLSLLIRLAAALGDHQAEVEYRRQLRDLEGSAGS